MWQSAWRVGILCDISLILQCFQGLYKKGAVQRYRISFLRKLLHTMIAYLGSLV